MVNAHQECAINKELNYEKEATDRGSGVGRRKGQKTLVQRHWNDLCVGRHNIQKILQGQVLRMVAAGVAGAGVLAHQVGSLPKWRHPPGKPAGVELDADQSLPLQILAHLGQLDDHLFVGRIRADLQVPGEASFGREVEKPDSGVGRRDLEIEPRLLPQRDLFLQIDRREDVMGTGPGREEDSSHGLEVVGLVALGECLPGV